MARKADNGMITSLGLSTVLTAAEESASRRKKRSQLPLVVIFRQMVNGPPSYPSILEVRYIVVIFKPQAVPKIIHALRHVWLVNCTKIQANVSLTIVPSERHLKER